MLFKHMPQDVFDKALSQARDIILQWVKGQHKYSRKYGFIASKSKTPSQASLPFSILRDTHGHFYLMDSDKQRTQSTTMQGAEGRYKLLEPVSLDQDGQLQLKDDLIGLKIEIMAPKNSQTTSLFSQPATIDLFDDIFGSSDKKEEQAEELGALKRMNYYLDDFVIGKKHYILIKHFPGTQLQHFIQECFAKRTAVEQIHLLENLLKYCCKAIIHCHQHGVIHNDTQFKNFIVNDDLSEVHLIDYGAALLSEDKNKRIEDFMCFNNQLQLIDPYLTDTNVLARWEKFKKAFSTQLYQKTPDANKLFLLINQFVGDAKQILTATQGTQYLPGKKLV